MANQSHPAKQSKSKNQSSPEKPPQKNKFDAPKFIIYPFFLIHMLMFGLSGFLMAYFDTDPDVLFLYAHGGIAITVYTVFYLAIFGRDEVKWMFINAALGILGIATQIGWILGLFGKKVSDFPASVHVIPFLYFIFYTFLIRHAITDLLRVNEDESRKKRVETMYVVVFGAYCLITWLLKN